MLAGQISQVQRCHNQEIVDQQDWAKVVEVDLGEKTFFGPEETACTRQS